MLDNFIILVVVLIVTGVMIRVARKSGKRNEGVDPSSRVYRVHAFYRWIPVFGLVGLYLTFFVVIAFDLESAKHHGGENLKKDIYFWVGAHVFVIISWMYLNNTKIYFDEDYLVRTTMFGTKKIPIDRIYQIVNNTSRGNSGAAMTKVYARVGGKRRIIPVEAMIDGYDTLIREIEYRAPRARRVEK